MKSVFRDRKEEGKQEKGGNKKREETGEFGTEGAGHKGKRREQNKKATKRNAGYRGEEARMRPRDGRVERKIPRRLTRKMLSYILLTYC